MFNFSFFLYRLFNRQSNYFIFLNLTVSLHRNVVFGSIGDSVNNANIKMAGSDTFGSPFALAMTGDSAMAARLQKVLKTAQVGGSKLDLNVLPLPDSIYPCKGFLKYGTKGCSTGSESDSFNILARFAGAKDEVAWASWMKNPPVFVLRVSADTMQA